MLKLTWLRQQRGWTRSELARRARMAGADIGKIESGRLRPYDSQLEKLAIALGLSEEAAATLTDLVTSDAEAGHAS